MKSTRTTYTGCFLPVIFLLLLGLSPIHLQAQIAYSTSFDGCTSATCASWTISGGSTPSITSVTGSNYTPCNTSSAKVNIYGSATTGTLVSTASLGTSTGMPATLGMSYKCINYTGGAATAAGNCTFTASWGTTASGPWNTISSFTNVSSTSCTATTFSAFTPTAGQPVFIRIVAVRSAGDFWAVMDNITLTQAAAVACSGTPAAGTAAISSATGCAATSFTLSATGTTSGSGITYQWQSSPTGSGSWTNIASATSTSLATTALVTTYYRLVTTCSNSGLTNTSNVVSYTVSCYSMPASGTTSYTSCSGTVYDPGGTGNYANNANSTLTIYPSVAGNMVSLTFSAFSTESGYDGLIIYNGNSTSAPMISSGAGAGAGAFCPAGSFYGTTVPGTITSSAADGSLTLYFRSDGSTVSSGFVASISCAPPASYLASWISMNTGAADWCAGETRTVSVTVKNIGSQPWPNSSPDINIGVKWNADADYFVKADANGLASGATQTFNFTVTAPSTGGSNNLTFDVINEGNCVFSTNSGSCGPGNSKYISSSINIKGTPVANAGPDVSNTCGSAVTLNGVPSLVTASLLKEDFEAAAVGIVSPTWQNWTEVYFSGYGETYWDINAICPLVGTKSMTLFDNWTYTSCDYDQTAAIAFGVAYDLPINATNYTNLKFNFKWSGVGQAGQDYAQVMYSFDGVTWTRLPTQYSGQATMQTVSDLDLSVLNGQQFYLGFYWRNNGSVVGSAFVVDDIQLMGDVLPNYSWSPATNLSATNIINPVATPPATTTYTLTASFNGCSSTDQVIVTSTGGTSAPTSVTGGGVVCSGNNVTLTANGGTLYGSAVYEWFTSSCGGTAAGTGPSITVSPTSTTTYYVRTSAVGSCAATACANGTVTLPTSGTTLSNNNESATCVVTENNYIHFYHSSGRLLASINSHGQNLGNVSVTSYLEGSPLGVQACNSPLPSAMTAVLARHWVITPQFQPASPVTLRLPFDNSSEFSALVSVANTNANPLDDLSGIGSLKLSKYSGPANVDNSAANNCVGAGGSGGTTLLSQAGNGNVNSYLAGFSGNEKYLEFSVPGFSEFWLHGNSGSSPLPIQMTEFSVNCGEGKAELFWSTASEMNSQKFIAERSRDLSSWDYVGELAAAGNSNYQINYKLTDLNPIGGISYYRLVQVDNDGEQKAYGPVSVSCSGAANSILVFPNPSKGDFTVEINSNSNVANAQIQLTDLAGKVISTRALNLHEGNNQVLFSGAELQMGTYIVKLVSESEYKPVKLVIH